MNTLPSASSAAQPATRPSVPLLRVDALAKSFGGIRAVDEVGFELAAGELLALIGPNGAGKSTCFNCINGQLRPDSGRVLLGGEDLVGRAPRAIWRLGVGRTFQIAATWSSMTVAENVQLALLSHAGRIRQWWGRASAMMRDDALALLDAVGLAAMADAPCGALAYGDVKRVELAIALANRPRLLLMDEPTAGMAPRERNELVGLVKRLVRERGIGVLFTEHSMDVVFEYADRIIVLARGRLIAEGTPAAIRDDAQVREVYFGTAGAPRAGAVR
jgi:branched-chain amino acid transport system ATP-binding protein